MKKLAGRLVGKDKISDGLGTCRESANNPALFTIYVQVCCPERSAQCAFSLLSVIVPPIHAVEYPCQPSSRHIE